MVIEELKNTYFDVTFNLIQTYKWLFYKKLDINSRKILLQHIDYSNYKSKKSMSIF